MLTGKQYAFICACCVAVSFYYLFEVHAGYGFESKLVLGSSLSFNPPLKSASIHAPSPSDARVNIEDSRVVWNADDVPLTSLVQHEPGFTVLNNAYALNGTIYIVQADENPAKFPERYMMISDGSPRLDAQPARDRGPTDKNMRIVNVTEARGIFGRFANRMEGTSFICYDDVKYFAHYYHFSAEILLGLWRAYSSLDSSITAAGHTKLSQPRRFITPNIATSTWRDYAGMNQYVIHSALPGTGLEFKDDWFDRAQMFRPFVFDRIVLSDSTASRRDPEFDFIEKTTVMADRLPKSPHWWAPVRWNVVTFSGLQRDPDIILERKPVITYISRQAWGRRMLRKEDHEVLVKGLEKLRETHGWELNVVEMENMSRMEQVKLIGRTTILLGVHGNGLTHLLWMQPTQHATVMEFFNPTGFSEDYEYTARMLGIRHYAWWNTTRYTYPVLPKVGFPDSFHSNEIPLDAEQVVQLTEQRLLGEM